MKRIPEPELMEAPDQARAYAEADFSEPHNMFVDALAERITIANTARTVLDLGCGAADISIRFAQRYPEAMIYAVDGAAAMLDEARKAIDAAGLQARIRLFEQNLPNLDLPPGQIDLIMSNSLLHHLHKPETLWTTIRQHATDETVVFIMDLMRPDNEIEAERLVRQYAADEPGILRRDFHNSLLAAFTPIEVNQQLHAAGLGHLTVEILSDRHLCVHGPIQMH